VLHHEVDVRVVVTVNLLVLAIGLDPLLLHRKHDAMFRRSWLVGSGANWEVKWI
jgi:hypothetical protein